MVSHGDCHMMAVLVCKGHPIAGLRLMDSSRCDPGKGLVLLRWWHDRSLGCAAQGLFPCISCCTEISVDMLKFSVLTSPMQFSCALDKMLCGWRWLLRWLWWNCRIQWWISEKVLVTVDCMHMFVSEFLWLCKHSVWTHDASQDSWAMDKEVSCLPVGVDSIHAHMLFYQSVQSHSFSLSFCCLGKISMLKLWIRVRLRMNPPFWDNPYIILSRHHKIFHEIDMTPHLPSVLPFRFWLCKQNPMKSPFLGEIPETQRWQCRRPAKHLCPALLRSRPSRALTYSLSSMVKNWVIEVGISSFDEWRFTFSIVLGVLIYNIYIYHLCAYRNDVHLQSFADRDDSVCGGSEMLDGELW